jgi:hypothetical protein
VAFWEAAAASSWASHGRLDAAACLRVVRVMVSVLGPPRSGMVGAAAVLRAVVGARRRSAVVAPVCWSGGSRPWGGRQLLWLRGQR